MYWNDYEMIMPIYRLMNLQTFGVDLLDPDVICFINFIHIFKQSNGYFYSPSDVSFNFSQSHERKSKGMTKNDYNALQHICTVCMCT